MEACAICLATDIRMHSIRNGELKVYIQAVTRYCEDLTLEYQPEFICYICAVHLVKCCRFIEKALNTQDALAILKHSKKATKTANKKSEPLTTLTIHNITQSNIQEYIYDEKSNKSHQVINNLNKENTVKTESEIEKEEFKQEWLEVDECDNDDDEYKNEEIFFDVTTRDSDFDSEDEKALVVPCINKLLKGEQSENIIIFALDSDEGDINKTMLTKTHKKSARKKKGAETKCKKERRRKDPTDMSPVELLMKEHFDIEALTLEEQISEWKEINRRRAEGKKFICEICTKSYTQHSAYETHVTGHDPSRGPASCPVCKLRYKSEVLVRSHVKFSHSKKYHCKACNRTFNTLCMAKRHQKWHSGQVYRCQQCAFSTQHEALLSKHVRIRHAVKFACSICGNGFISQAGLRLHTAKSHGGVSSVDATSLEVHNCKECSLSFTSDTALRVHLMTSFQHKRKGNLNDPSAEDPIARRTCKSCGKLFASLPELTAHTKDKHPKRKPQQHNDEYPTQCEHCEVIVHSRNEHWKHVRQTHPKERASYRAVIAAVCETCGKGFQNTTKLQLHELRHASPTVRCEFCDKLFYDRFRLNDHLSIHREAYPHSCRTCGRGFKALANLTRHYKTHTDVASYECNICRKMFKYSTSLNLHVRSVHFKIPPPPRKKRTRNKSTGVTLNNLCNTNT